MGRRGLTLRQQVFVREYVRTRDVKAAAQAAGMKWPRRAGHRMFKSAAVQAAIALREEQAAKGAKLTAEAAKALTILLDLMENARTDSVRLRAAREVLAMARSGQEEGREKGREDAGRERRVIDYGDPAAVAARVEELRRRLESSAGGGGDA